jgi:hypothetical protein
MTATEIERTLRIALCSAVAGYMLLGQGPRDAAESARAMFEEEQLSKLDPATAAPLRRTADLALMFVVSELIADPKGWSRIHPDGVEGVRLVRLLCYIEVARKLFEGEAPGEIRSAMRRIVSGLIDNRGPSPDAHRHELIWEIASETVDRAIHALRPVDGDEKPESQR